MSSLRISAVILAFIAAGNVFGQAPEAREERQGEVGAMLQNGVLRVGIDCSPARPCKARFGNTVHMIKNAATVKRSDPASGLVFIYIDPSGNLTAGSTVNLACDGCRYARGVTQFPANSIPLFTWTVVKSPVASAGISDFRAELAAKNIVSGPGIMTTDNEGTTTIAVDPTVVSLHASAPPRNSTSSCSAGEFSFDSDYYYVCVAANKWKRAALSNF